MRKALAFFLLSLLPIFLPTNASAFDGRRQGFILGGGVGFGRTSYRNGVEYANATSMDEWKSDFSFMTDLKIGYAPTNSIEICSRSRTSWFSHTGSIIAHSYETIDLTLFARPLAPAFYVTGGAGLAVGQQQTRVLVGPGVILGFGFETGSHAGFEIDVMYGRPERDNQFFKEYTARVVVLVTGY